MNSLHVKNAGSGVAIYEGDAWKLENLFNALIQFPSDIVRLEIVHEDGSVIKKWLSPEWND